MHHAHLVVESCNFSYHAGHNRFCGCSIPALPICKAGFCQTQYNGQPMNIFRNMVVSVIILFITYTPAKAEGVLAKLKIILRYDDYSNYTSMELAQSFIETAKNIGAGVLVGVIPFPYGDYPESDTLGTILQPFLSMEKTALLKKYFTEGSIEIALHGFSHKNNVTTGRHSEFSGLPENEQALLLRMAKESLETATGAIIRTFVPPFNQYDAATLKALEKTGFKILSAGMGSYSKTDSRLLFLPGTTYIDQLRDVVYTAISEGHMDATVIVTVHPYDIIESGEKLPEFKKGHGQVSMRSIKDDLNQIIKSDAVQPSSIETLLANGEDLSIERWQANLQLKQNAITHYRILPDSFHLYPLPGLYYSRDSAERMHSNQTLSAVILYGGLTLVIAFITRVIIRRLTGHYKNITIIIGVIALSGVIGIVTLTMLSGFHTIFAAAMACCLGILAAALTNRFVCLT